MKLFLYSTISVIIVLAFASASISFAAYVGDQNWADDVEQYTDNIQNFGWVMMDASTEWWLTGEPDATSNSSSIIDDFDAGWRAESADECIVMHWDTPLVDWPGDDLVIRLFSGGKTVTDNRFANVSASVDGITYVNIGTLGKGSSLVFREETFDFAGQLEGDISYVKVERVAIGSGTGMFFDAFGGTVTPDLIPGDANNDKRVDSLDASALAQHWQDGYATWAMGDFNDDDVVNASDASIMAANWGYGTEDTSSSVPEPSACVLLAFALTLFWRRRG